jgi:hypothetical protein
LKTAVSPGNLATINTLTTTTPPLVVPIRLSGY